MIKIQRSVTVINKLGLHARASAQLVKLAGTFNSNIWLTLDHQTANGKNIMELMMLAASQGSKIVVTAEGTDAANAVADIETLFVDRFGETE
ncbi:MAG: HPr family phosphocarrier protein [Acidiferrobacteraceae bacterium]|nr:HPr family phosphocarrier protein [Acidiferrobacteraceae bacterium]|tara:strand:- start:3064 stop:3339 length:276 start_codon:yes stop_codon:yes gene_type:complete